MKLRGLLWLLGSMPLLVGAPLEVEAANLYRYRDDHGILVIGATIPPEFVKNGYEVLGPNGRVLEVVPPAPTAEERAARAAAEAEAKRQEEEARKRAEEDAYLLRVYSTPDEAIRARDRRLQEIDSLIRLKQSNIQVIGNQIKDIETQAANIERSGRSVPEEMQENIARLQASIAELERDVTKILGEKETTERDFARKIERLHYLQQVKAAKANGG